MQIGDILMLTILAAVIPTVGWLTWPKTRERLRQGRRAPVYLTTMGWQWALTAGLLAAWTLAGRGWADLGFAVKASPGFWLAMAVVLVGVGFLVAQTLAVGQAKFREWARGQIEPLAFLMPQDPTELRAFSFLSLTAGFCEEVLYRGYLMWALSLLGGWPLAIAGSTLVFSLSHLYQHPQGVLRVAGIGLLTAGLYGLSGSLLPVMILHVAIDLSAGFVSYRVMTRAPAAPLAA